ncbi:hypothetical protein [uncultured Croceitalea sp.]|uniref:hypothetical protein n=1 Tax=uncultured Croceitalea sp. TaxID=1798908 RepID=UPI00330662CE
MPTTIHINSVIERPKAVVKKALLEGLTVFRDLGNISEVRFSASDDVYHAKLNNELLCKGLKNVHFTISLHRDKSTEERTHFNSEIRYRYPAKYSLARIVHKLMLKRYLTFEAKSRFGQFKYRIEKWL